jgi:hypothetical protein
MKENPRCATAFFQKKYTFCKVEFENKKESINFAKNTKQKEWKLPSEHTTTLLSIQMPR